MAVQTSTEYVHALYTIGVGHLTVIVSGNRAESNCVAPGCSPYCLA